MGHRGNLIRHENRKTLGCSHRGFALDVPSLMALGESPFLAWFQAQFDTAEQVDRPPRAIWDEIYTEAAILVNFDAQSVIFGFWEWVPDVRGYDEMSEEMHELIEYRDLSLFLLNLVRERWPGWEVQLALPAEFATQETLVVLPSELAPPLIVDVHEATGTGWTDERVLAALNAGFASSYFRPPLINVKGVT